MKNLEKKKLLMLTTIVLLQCVTIAYPASVGSWRFPLDSYTIECEFAVECFKPNHLGEDVHASAGTKVYPITTGTVKHVQNHTGEHNYGGAIIIEHTLNGETITSLYAHLDPASFQVSVGDTISDTSRYIAKVGSSEVNGNFSPHLHLGIRKGGYDSRMYYPCGSNSEWTYAGYTSCPQEVYSNWYDPSAYIGKGFGLGFFSSTAWNNDISPTFIEAAANQKNVPLYPSDNGGGIYVHSWNGTYVQDVCETNTGTGQYACSSDLRGMLVYNSKETSAYYLKDGMYGAFVSWDVVGNLGFPTSDEIKESKNYNGTVKQRSVMHFDKGGIWWIEEANILLIDYDDLNKADSKLAWSGTGFSSVVTMSVANVYKTAPVNSSYSPSYVPNLNNFLKGGRLNTIELSPEGDLYTGGCFATGTAWLAISHDGGLSWSYLSSPSSYSYPHYFQFDPDNIHRFLMGSYDGLYEYSNGAWYKFSNNSGTTTSSAISLCPTDRYKRSFWATMPGSGIVKFEGGYSQGEWNGMGSQFPTAGSANAIAYDPNNSKKVYIGNASGLYQCTDETGYWPQSCWRYPELEGWSITDIAIPANSNGTTVYVSGMYKMNTNYYKGMVARSSSPNYANSFKSVFAESNNGYETTKVHTIELNPVNPSLIYAGTDSGLWRTSDAGSRWDKVDDRGPLLKIKVSPDGKTVYGANYGRFWYSDQSKNANDGGLVVYGEQ